MFDRLPELSSLDWGNLIYLGALLAVLLSYMLVASRRQMGQMMRHGALWTLIFLGAILGVVIFNDLRAEFTPRAAMTGEAIAIPRAMDGHFYLTLAVNGQPVRFVVDTGASQIVLSQDDAKRVGIDAANLIYSARANTANGVVETAPVRLAEITFEGITRRNMAAVVNRGQMDQSLLGMTYLSGFSRILIENGQMRLEP